MDNDEYIRRLKIEFDILSDDEEDICVDDESLIMNKNKNNPWFNEDIASIVKLCRKYRRKHHKSKTKKNELKQICKELEKKKRKLIRAAKQKWNETQKFFGINHGNNNNNNNNNNNDKIKINTNINIDNDNANQVVMDNINIDPPTPPLLTPEPPTTHNITDNMTDPVYEIYTMIRDNGDNHHI